MVDFISESLSFDYKTWMRSMLRTPPSFVVMRLRLISRSQAGRRQELQPEFFRPLHPARDVLRLLRSLQTATNADFPEKRQNNGFSAFSGNLTFLQTLFPMSET